MQERREERVTEDKRMSEWEENITIYDVMCLQLKT